MRKITSLLMLLCAFVGAAWAQEEDLIIGLNSIPTASTAPADITTGYYLLKEVNPDASGKPGGYLKAASEASDAAVTPIGKNTTLTADAALPTHIWYIEKSGTGADATYTIATANKVAAWQAPLTHEKKLVAYASKGTLTITTQTVTLGSTSATPANGSFIVQNSDKTACVHYSGNNLGSWTDANSASVMMFEAYKLSDSDLKKENPVIASIRQYLAANSAGSDVRVGQYTVAAHTAIKTAFDAYDANPNSTTRDKAIAAYNDGARVTLSAGEKFVLKCKASDRGYLVYSTVEGKGSDDEPWVAGTSYDKQPSDVDAEGVYKEWTYVTVNGSNYLFNVEKKMSVLTGTGTTEELSFANRGTAFELISGTDGVSNIKMNDRYLASAASWNGTHPVRRTTLDNGAKFYIEKVDASIDATLQSELEMRATYGAVDEWKTAQVAVLGYVGGYAKSEQANIEAINDFAGLEAFINEKNVVALENGGYYFVKTGNNQNAGQNRYMSYSGTDCYVYELADGEKPGVQYVWQFNAPADGGYKLQSCNLGKYLQTVAAGGVSTIIADMDYGFKYEFTDNGFAEMTIKDGDDKVLRTENLSGGKAYVNQWTNGTTNMNTNATWYIIPAEELNVSVDQYATIHLPFAVALSEGFEAYGVTNVSTSYATMSEAKTEIPANTGAILKGDGQCTLTIKDATTAWGNNALEGTNVVTYLPKQAYILSGDGENIGFYRALLNMDENGQVVGEETGTCFKNGANKAYLPVPAGENPGRFLNFDFGGTETGIEGIDSAKENAAAVVYDLSGRRVKNAQKGIYIVNGKKVIK